MAAYTRPDSNTAAFDIVTGLVNDPPDLDDARAVEGAAHRLRAKLGVDASSAATLLLSLAVSPSPSRTTAPVIAHAAGALSPPPLSSCS